jgi:hypothetical protein
MGLTVTKVGGGSQAKANVGGVSQSEAKVGGGAPDVDITVTMSGHGTEWTRHIEYSVPSGTTYEDVMKIYLAEPTHGDEFRGVKKFIKAELYAIGEDGDIINPHNPDDAEAHPLRELAIRVHSDPVNNIKSPIQTSGQLLHFTVLLPRAEVSQAEAKARASYECPVDMTTDDDDVPTVELIVDAFYDFDGLSSMTNWCRLTFNVVPGTTTVQQLADTYMHLPVHNGDKFKGHPLTHMICHTTELCDLDKHGGLIGRFSPVSMTDRIVKNGQLLRLYVGPRVLVKVQATYVIDGDWGFETIKWEKFVPLCSTYGAAITAFIKDHPSEDTMQPQFSYQIDGGQTLSCHLDDVIEHDGTLVLSFL